MTKALQNRVKELRKQADFTQQELSEQLGVKRETVSNWERGKNHISLANIAKLSQLFQVPIENLLGYVDKENE